MWGEGCSYKWHIRVPEKVRDLNKGDEGGSHTDTWGGSIPAEGTASANIPEAGDRWGWINTVYVSVAGME